MAAFQVLRGTENKKFKEEFVGSLDTCLSLEPRYIHTYVHMFIHMH